LEDEIAWANATKLTVTVDFPDDWGTSDPSGRISNTLDIRQGMRPFELGFTPSQAYAFRKWRAYYTSDLEPDFLGGDDWKVDLDLLDNKKRESWEPEPLQPIKELVSLGLVEVPELTERGGRGKFLIHTDKPVTLIPWSETEPYVTRTEPRTEAENSLNIWGVLPTRPFIAYFNAPLREPDNGFKLGGGVVEIQARGVETIATNGVFVNRNVWFDRIEYESSMGLYALVI
jgi:hypothetical protein